MAHVPTTEFDEGLRSVDCSQEIRDIVARLRSAAQQGGPVEWQAHSNRGGWGIAAKRANRVFCRFDPKPTVPHVCVNILGADDEELNIAGTVHRRKNAPSWVDVCDVPSALLLQPFIARAYHIAESSRSRSRPRVASARANRE